MKRFLDVERTRVAYHADRARNSTHRASLLVPELPNSAANISFLNHFLLKRDYRSVACRVTAIDPDGNRIESRLIPVDAPRAYTVPLSGMVRGDVASYMVEFFSADNLFIPFPAVMINHVGSGFHNSVHAYNRVLNDAFEDDEINRHHQREAAIDVRLDKAAESFLVFHAGPRRVDGSLSLELTGPDGRSHSRRMALAVPKLCYRMIRLSEAFPDLPNMSIGVLKVLQPAQFLFYGRMLVGQIAPDGSFSANHSYYDCADFAEYWENDSPSLRNYPYLQDYDNLVRFYPIMSPGRLALSVALFTAEGRPLGQAEIGEVATPGGVAVEASIAGLATDIGVDPATIGSFQVTARPMGGATPTRINHQIVYRAGGIESSINISLGNPNTFTPDNKTGFCWGQLTIADDLRTTLGIVAMMPGRGDSVVDIAYYGERGLLLKRTHPYRENGAIVIDLERELGSVLTPELSDGGGYVWYSVTSPRADMTAFATTRHIKTGHAAGEHSF